MSGFADMSAIGSVVLLDSGDEVSVAEAPDVVMDRIDDPHSDGLWARLTSVAQSVSDDDDWRAFDYWLSRSKVASVSPWFPRHEQRENVAIAIGEHRRSHNDRSPEAAA